MSTESDPLLGSVAINEPSNTSEIATMSESNFNYGLRVLVGCVYSVAYSLIGASVFVILWFSFRSNPIGVFELHIIFSVIGYQLLMGVGILSLNNYNLWSSHLTLPHRHRAHWILQLMGSGLAIAGSIIMMMKKSVNFNTIHGKLAVAALIMTFISLANGLMTLYRIRIRRVFPANVFKTGHLIFGTAAFMLSSVCLIFGYNKNSFQEWASKELSIVVVAVTCIYTVIVIAKPCFILWKKLTYVMKIKIF